MEANPEHSGDYLGDFGKHKASLVGASSFMTGVYRWVDFDHLNPKLQVRCS